jgi:uncharacterized protein (DUF302 family)
MNTNGLNVYESCFDSKETMERLVTGVTSRGATIFARIDHAAAAALAGLALASTEVLIVGTPRSGTLLMQSCRAVAIDLPLKALVWTDEKGRCLLAYDDPEWLAERHQLDERTAQIRKSMASLLVSVSREATRAEDGEQRR